MPVCLASDSQVNMNRPLPELLAPAGSIDALLAAVAAGADAVYCGLGAFNARASAKDIEPVEFARAVRLAHAHGVRVYVTCNVYLREHELVPALDLVREADAAGADAFIVADVAQVRAIRRAIPHAEIHLSTQTGVMSPAGVEYVREHLRVERITVSRELSLSEIASVCSVGMPIEVFCHGAICICYSGACAASALRRGRSANRGDCTQPCRFTYDLQDGEGSSVNVQEGERLLCPRDYCSIDHVRELVEAGVSALKIEGRMKNPDYVFNVVGAYRRALDAVGAGSWDSDVAAACKRKLGMSFNRGFTDAYLRGASGAELMSFERACNQGLRVGGLVERRYEEVSVRLCDAVRAGDMLEIRSTPGPDAPADVPKRWPQVPCPVDAKAGEVIDVHCKRKVEVGSIVNRISSVEVLERTDAALARMRTELESYSSDYLPAHVGRCASEPLGLSVEPAVPTARGACLSVAVDTPVRAAALLHDVRVDEVVVRQMALDEDADAWEDLLPRLTVMLDEPARMIDETRTRCLCRRARKVICRNYAHVQMAKETGVPFDVAAPLSATNGQSAAWFGQCGASCVWLPDELSLDEAREAVCSAAHEGVRVGMLACGYPQLMVTEHCLLTAEGPCSHSCGTCERRRQERYLVEASGARLPVRVDAHGRTRTFDACMLNRTEDVDALLRFGASGFAIDAMLLDEGELECAIDTLAAACAAASEA